jgi:hypothetical protein
MSLLLVFNGPLPAGPSLPAEVRPYGRGSTAIEIVKGAILAIEENGTITAGNGIALVGTRSQVASDLQDPGSINVTNLVSAEHLCVRCAGLERPTAGTWTVTASFTTIACNGTTGSTADTDMDACGEYRIFTGTTNASNPTGTNVDGASVYWAVDEVTTLPRVNRMSRIGKRPDSLRLVQGP